MKKKKKFSKKKLKKNKFSNALCHHCTDAWVTRPERPKGLSLEVGARRAPRLLVKQ